MLCGAAMGLESLHDDGLRRSSLSPMADISNSTVDLLLV